MGIQHGHYENPELPSPCRQVELLSGKALREPGVSYQCHLLGGKHTCVERDVEIIPMEKVVTVLPEDSFGISKILPDYVVETTLHRTEALSTRIEISHYYSTNTLKAKLTNLIAASRLFAKWGQLHAVRTCLSLLGFVVLLLLFVQGK